MLPSSMPALRPSSLAEMSKARKSEAGDWRLKAEGGIDEERVI
jgi:hypothetical protein